MSIANYPITRSRSLSFGEMWSRKVAPRAGILLALAIVASVAIIFLMPLYWMFSGSFKFQTATMQVPPEFIPSKITLQNYVDLFTSRFPVVRWLANSIIVSTGASLLTLVVSSLTGYSFGKKVFPGQNVLFFILLACMMLPKQVTLIPLFLLMKNLGLYNTYPGLILPLAASPFGIFLMKQFMSSIPNELLDAAKIDGASEWGTYRHIVLPLSVPALGALGIFAFMNAWGDFMWQLIMVRGNDMMTITVGIAKLASIPVGNLLVRNYGLLMAGGTFGALPMIIFFLLFQRYFVKGITTGAVKG